ncbi:MAG: Pyruvate ferredoxin oxidoreductase alpha subunit [candidate division Zixibacteria bacterium RBG-1]|nr:MAG: Pyruvate ferredoxin oxidoreductase alpha subunit [candidate division Zixibacteria bacterium RBG-1]OGC85613.1 MAG: pyruvate ferredoxin oxidoreductase [candidate division Zixibacteria bacterium RBG_19FT_COMBO_42_43]
MKKVLEGSKAIAEAVKLCRPQVISAYPITPQTHIVEALSRMVAEGQLKAEFINVESEFSAASVILGACAAGSRAYSTTTSQGLLLMVEVLFNLAGMRLPVVLTCTNRSVSAPINIWNDHQDVMTIRDAGLILLFAEDNQEAYDLHFVAYKVGESKEVSLPVVVNMDGFILTHAYEPIEILTQEQVDEFLPPFQPLKKLDPENPATFGMLADPGWYLETRISMQKAMENSKSVLKQVIGEFRQKFGRLAGDLLETYRMEQAKTAFVAMGSMVGTLKDMVDEERDKGNPVGLVKVRSFRPFPEEELREVLGSAEKILVLEKAFSLGLGGILYHELRSALYGLPLSPQISGYVLGLGGRDIPKKSLSKILEDFNKTTPALNFVDAKENILKEHLYV